MLFIRFGLPEARPLSLGWVRITAQILRPAALKLLFVIDDLRIM